VSNPRLTVGMALNRTTTSGVSGLSMNESGDCRPRGGVTACNGLSQFLLKRAYGGKNAFLGDQPCGSKNAGKR